MKKKRLNWYLLINLSLALIAVASFIISLTKTRNTITTCGSTQQINVGTIASYLKFLPENKTQTIIQIALHNFALALIAYILSLFSCGVLGIAPLCSAFLVAGSVIQTSTNITTISFVTLELIGMSLAVFGGSYVFNQRKRNNLSLKKVFVISLCLTIVLVITYLFAAYIETELIQNLWR